MAQLAFEQLQQIINRSTNCFTMHLTQRHWDFVTVSQCYSAKIGGGASIFWKGARRPWPTLGYGPAHQKHLSNYLQCVSVLLQIPTCLGVRSIAHYIPITNNRIPTYLGLYFLVMPMSITSAHQSYSRVFQEHLQHILKKHGYREIDSDGLGVDSLRHQIPLQFGCRAPPGPTGGAYTTVPRLPQLVSQVVSQYICKALVNKKAQLTQR